MASSGKLQALILAGGRGTRFWPVSRSSRPKQLLALDAEESLLRRTMLRLEPLVRAESVWVCTTRELAAAVREQLPEVPSAQILGEPTGRDTAPAIGWSVQRMRRAKGDSAVAVLPADHRMEDGAAFRRSLETAAGEVERSDRVMTLGVKPRWPETGYGYLEQGEVLDDSIGLRRVRRFTEKPDAESAETFVASGDYLWNAGIFVFRAGRLWDLLSQFEPQVAAGLEEIERRPQSIDELYGKLRKVSIDYAVMERCDDLGTLPLDCGWSDLGSWEALAEVLTKDSAGNSVRGDVLDIDSSGNLLFAEQGFISVVGVSDLVVVRTADSVLVMPRSRSQEVKEVVDRLSERGRDELL
jgi:mannose-1-phosphate guanylyltransferase/mannose-6-phosphate isomerase